MSADSKPHEDESQRPADPRGVRCWLTNGFIAVFLIFQIITPLRYYFGDDRHDERFSWRMFSTVRQQRKEQRALIHVVEIRERDGTKTERVISANTLLPERWAEFFEKRNEAVIRKFLTAYCEETDADLLRLEIRQWRGDGSLPATHYVTIDCRTREIRDTEHRP